MGSSRRREVAGPRDFSRGLDCIGSGGLPLGTAGRRYGKGASGHPPRFFSVLSTFRVSCHGARQAATLDSSVFARHADVDRQMDESAVTRDRRPSTADSTLTLR